MTLAFIRPRIGKVWEHDADVDIDIERVAGEYAECDVALQGQSAWMRSGKNVALGRCVFNEDGRGKLKWKVTSDLPSGDYALKATIPNARPAIEMTIDVVIVERVRVTRTSAGEATVEWDARAIPVDYAPEDGWKLAIDIVPDIGEGEDVSAVVSQAFMLAAESGVKTHTKDARVLCHVSDAEIKQRWKRVKLLPNRICSVGLCAFGDDSDAMADYITSRASVDTRSTQIEITASGYPSQSTSSRSICSADGHYARYVPVKVEDGKQEDGEELKDVADIGMKELAIEEDVNAGLWKTAEVTDGWRQDPGLNVVIIRADDFKPVYENNWDTSGGARRAKDIELALQSFMKAFFDGGEVDVARKSVTEHMLCITTCGPWAGGAPKLAEKVTKALQLVIVGILGADDTNDETTLAIQNATALADKPLALAVLSHGNAKSKVHTWIDVGPSKGKAFIRATLTHASGGWFPTLVQRGTKERASDLFVPWKDFSEEGWGVMDEAGRLNRYSQLMVDTKSAIFDSTSGSRVSVYNLVRALVKYSLSPSANATFVPSVDMLLGGIILTRGALAAAECVNAGAVEYIAQRVCACISDAGTHNKLEVLDKAYVKSLLKLLTVDNFALYAECIRRGAAESALRIIHAFWNGSSTFFGNETRQSMASLAEHMALTDLATVRIAAKHEDISTSFTALRSSLTCSASDVARIEGEVYILDIEAPKDRDGFVELPRKQRMRKDASPPMTPAQKILKAYDDIWEGGESPDKDGDKDWTMIDAKIDKGNDAEKQDASEVCTPVAKKPTTIDKYWLEADEMPFAGGIVVLCAKDRNWDAHVAMIRQAPRLVWRARERGARAVIFVWPMRTPSCVAVQPLLASPNFDTATNIPAFVVDEQSLLSAVSCADDCTFVIDVKLTKPTVGLAQQLAMRIGHKLAEACADRPPPIEPKANPPSAGRFRGRFKFSADEVLLPKEVVASPSSQSAGEGFAALIRRVTFTGEPSKDESKADESKKPDEESDNIAALQKLKEKVKVPPMGDDSHLDAWRSANVEGGVSQWTRAMRLVTALGDHGAELLDHAYNVDPTSPNANETPIRILSLDGGGMRGIATLVMLERILKATQNWCVGDCFDLIVGTSTGGIIAVGTGLLRMTTEELNELYTNMGDEIFPKKDSYITQVYKAFQRGQEEARNFEIMLNKALDGEAEKPLYTIASHPRWYSSRFPPPRVALVSRLVSRSPTTTFLMRSYHHEGQAKGHLGRLPGEHRASLVQSIRATTAAPWYLEELKVDKEIGGTGGCACEAKTDSEQRQGEASASGANGKDSPGTGASGAIEDDVVKYDVQKTPTHVQSELRLIDGAIASNNPTAVAVFEARRLFSQSRPLCVVSLGTGASVPHARGARNPGWLDNTIHATCDVDQVDATIRHLLGSKDSYYRFQPIADIFGCELNDTSPETAAGLRRGAAAYMDSMEHQVNKLASVLRREYVPAANSASSSVRGDDSSPPSP